MRNGSEIIEYVDGCEEGHYCPISSDESYCTKIPEKKDEGENAKLTLIANQTTAIKENVYT